MTAAASAAITVIAIMIVIAIVVAGVIRIVVVGLRIPVAIEQWIVRIRPVGKGFVVAVCGVIGCVAVGKL